MNDLKNLTLNQDKMMIIGCGIDLVSVSRIKKIINRWNSQFLQKVYTEQEIRYCEKKNKNKYQSYAGFFAAKEAYVKAMGTGFRNIKWKEIEINRDSLDKPMIQFSDRLIIINKTKNIDFVHLSISHTKKFAVAQVIIEKNNYI